MQTITDVLTRCVQFFSGDASFSKNLVYAFLTLAAGYALWTINRRVLKIIESKAVAFKILQIRTDVFVIAQKVSCLLSFWLVGFVWIRLFDLSVIEKSFHALFIVLSASPLNSFLQLLLGLLETRLAERTETHMDNIIIELLNKFSGAIVYATAIIMGLDLIGVNVMPFIAGAGVMGVAVGFAAKDTLSNLIAGILLIIDRPFEIGDRIEVWSSPSGSSSWGDVVDIGLRATRIKTTDNIVVIIPNNEIMTRDIVNYTILSKSIRVRVNIGIAYDSDIEKAKALTIQATESADWILSDPAPKVVVKDFGESSVDLQLRVWIKDARKRMDTISTITDTVKNLFDENGIDIPFPRRDIAIVSRASDSALQPAHRFATLKN
jgi:small-conductance mechanosensitive channel